jgi:hypothetical protein
MQLMNPETWLPADAWLDPVARPYDPSRFVLLLRTEIGPSGVASMIEALEASWPFSVGPLALGETLPTTAGPQAQTTRCVVLANDDVVAVKDAVVRAGGFDPIYIQGTPESFASFAARDRNSALILSLRPLLPDHASCIGEYVL